MDSEGIDPAHIKKLIVWYEARDWKHQVLTKTLKKFTQIRFYAFFNGKHFNNTV